MQIQKYSLTAICIERNTTLSPRPNHFCTVSVTLLTVLKPTLSSFFLFSSHQELDVPAERHVVEFSLIMAAHEGIFWTPFRAKFV